MILENIVLYFKSGMDSGKTLHVRALNDPVSVWDLNVSLRWFHTCISVCVPQLSKWTFLMWSDTVCLSCVYLQWMCIGETVSGPQGDSGVLEARPGVCVQMARGRGLN